MKKSCKVRLPETRILRWCVPALAILLPAMASCSSEADKPDNDDSGRLTAIHQKHIPLDGQGNPEQPLATVHFTEIKN